MTKTELCEMCEEYAAGTKCEYEYDCKIMQLYYENASLRKDNAQLRKDNADMKNKMSYMVNPLSLGDRNNQMGW